MSKTNIYVLKLEGGKYYVGKSHDLITRYQQHLNGEGSAYTRKYRPVKMVQTITNVSPFEEDKITKEYMSKYGVENVRGGSYANPELTDFQLEALRAEMCSANDLCSNCGRSGHFIKDCYVKPQNNSNKNINSELQHTTCRRCGRKGHSLSDCYAGRHVRGFSLDESDDYADSDSDDYDSDDDSDDY
jgi:predicted GIY-YIG superfamily endonuclease